MPSPEPGGPLEYLTSNGDRVRIRPVRPADKAGLRRGFERLSFESRYRRFLAHKKYLSDSDLSFVDESGRGRHYALVALALDASEREQACVGVARFVRLAEAGCVAEMAVTVIDDYQRRGIGKALTRRLLADARSSGITRVRVTLLADNVPMRRLIASAFGTVAVKREGGLVSAELPLPDAEGVDNARSGEALFELLRLAAEESILPLSFFLSLSRHRLGDLRRRLAGW